MSLDAPALARSPVVRAELQVAAGGGVEPLVFAGMLGWLHRPAGAPVDAGVVICAPVGRDARCAHLLLRWTAEAMAAAGLPVLRFDYLGCGDSLDLGPEADALAAWTANVHRAADALKAATGVRRLALCGLRLGAALAGKVAETRDDVDALVLLAPVTRGRAWLRELKLAAELSTPAHRSGPPYPGPAEAPAALESDGLQLSTSTVASLSGLDLLTLGRTPQDVLLLGGGEPLAARLQALGAQVEARAFPDHGRLFDESHSNHVPADLPSTLAAWAHDRLAPRASPAVRARIASPVELRPGGAVERPVSFGAGLRGVLCRPAAGGGDGRVAILCNTGGDPRVGAGRFSTVAARRLADAGVASLRFDFAGLGDSPLPSGPERSHVYETPREADLDAAIGFLAGEGLDRPVVAGLCAGAYHAFWGAVRDSRIEGVFLISLIKIVWRSGDSLDIGRRDEARATRSYVQGLRDPAVWRRIARGEVRLAPIAGSLLRRFTSRLGASGGQAERRRVRQAAAAIAARGGRAHMLLGLDDGALDEMQTYFGHDGQDWAVRPGFTVSVVDGLDHGLLRPASRAVATEELCRFMAGARAVR